LTRRRNLHECLVDDEKTAPPAQIVRVFEQSRARKTPAVGIVRIGEDNELGVAGSFNTFNGPDVVAGE
jgi:hypothetical protein